MSSLPFARGHVGELHFPEDVVSIVVSERLPVGVHVSVVYMCIVHVPLSTVLLPGGCGLSPLGSQPPLVLPLLL